MPNHICDSTLIFLCDSLRLEIEAIDEGTPVQTSRCTLRISVIDVNDNAPFFPSYAPVTVPEGMFLRPPKVPNETFVSNVRIPTVWLGFTWFDFLCILLQMFNLGPKFLK